MKEGEIQIISNDGPAHISNYTCYKTKRNGEVVQVESYETKA